MHGEEIRNRGEISIRRSMGFQPVPRSQLTRSVCEGGRFGGIHVIRRSSRLLNDGLNSRSTDLKSLLLGVHLKWRHSAFATRTSQR